MRANYKHSFYLYFGTKGKNIYFSDLDACIRKYLLLEKQSKNPILKVVKHKATNSISEQLNSAQELVKIRYDKLKEIIPAQAIAHMPPIRVII